MLDRIKKRHIVFLSLLFIIAIAVAFYVQDDQHKNGAFIRPYEEKTDFKPLVALMNENKFFISENPGFQPEKVLLLRAPNNNPKKKGTVSIDVIEVEDEAGGFIAYYKKSSDHGFIWLLAVNKIFRKQGFGEKLMTHAIENLKQKGAKYITLMTYLINKPALTLYKKVGFVEQRRDEERGVIFLIKKSL